MDTCLTTNNINFSMIKQCSGQQELFLDQHLMTERTTLNCVVLLLEEEEEIMTPIFFPWPKGLLEIGLKMHPL